MAAAFLVKYKHFSNIPGHNGYNRCPDAVVCLNSGRGEDVGELAPIIKKALVDARGGDWESGEVVIDSIKYLGPYFLERETFLRVRP